MWWIPNIHYDLRGPTQPDSSRCLPRRRIRIWNGAIPGWRGRSGFSVGVVRVAGGSATCVRQARSGRFAEENNVPRAYTSCDG